MKDNTTERIEMLEKRVQNLEGKHGKNFAVDDEPLGTEKRCSTLKAVLIAAALLCAPYLCVQLENKYIEYRFDKEMAEFKQFYPEHNDYEINIPKAPKSGKIGSVDYSPFIVS